MLLSAPSSLESSSKTSPSTRPRFESLSHHDAMSNFSILIDETNFPSDVLDKIQRGFDSLPRIIRVVDELGSGVTDHGILARMDNTTALATQDAMLHNTALRKGLMSFCWFQNELWKRPIPKVGTFQLRVVSLGLKVFAEPLPEEAALLIKAYNSTLGERAIKRNRTVRSRIAHRAISLSNITFVRCYLHTKTCGNSLLFGVSILAQSKERNVGTTEMYYRFHGIPHKAATHVALLVVLLKLLALHLFRACVVFYGDNEPIAAALKSATADGMVSCENDEIWIILAHAMKPFSAIEFGSNRDRCTRVAAKVQALSEHDAGGEMLETDYRTWSQALVCAIEALERHYGAGLIRDYHPNDLNEGDLGCGSESHDPTF